MNKLTLTALSTALAFAVSPVLANETEQQEVQVHTQTTETTVTSTRDLDFGTLDSDADGFVVQTEIPADAELAQVWVDYDADGDMKLSQGEFDAWVQVDSEEEAE